MDRQIVQRAVDQFFTARLTNDPEAVLTLFAEGAKVRMAGDETASEIAHQTSNAAQLRDSVINLVSTWHWSSADVSSLLIDDDSAAVRYQLTATYVPSGVTVQVESMDQLYFDSAGLITQMIEFVDTAKTEQLVQQAQRNVTNLSARAIPIASRDKLDALIAGIKSYPNKSDRDTFAGTFGGAVEDWFYQEIDGKPYVVAVIEGGDFEAGFAEYASSQQPYFLWFREQVLELTGIDMREVPGGGAAEHVFRFSPDL